MSKPIPLGFNALVSNKEKVGETAFAVLLIGGGLYAAKHGTGLIARIVENRLGKPSLVRETSRANYKVSSPLVWTFSGENCRFSAR